MSLRDELLNIRAQHGLLTPEVVVEEARPDDAPLHDHFEWDDETAAEAYRERQAADLIRSVKITYTRANGTQGQIREFHSLREEETGQMAYDPLDEITANPIATEMLRRQMRRDWESFRARYESFEEFRTLIGSALKEAS